MLQLTLIIFFEFVILFLLSRHLSSSLYTFFKIMTHSNYGATSLLTLLYLPGTVIHEFSHLIIAEILRVPTVGISFIPKIIDKNPKEQQIQAGSVTIGKTDILRKFLIAIAPLIIGLMFLLLLIWIYGYFIPDLTVVWQQIGFICLIGYLIFSVSNNMFSSKKDLEDSWAFIVILCLIAIVCYFFGLRINLTGQVLTLTLQLLNKLQLSLAIVIGVNFTILVINSLLLNMVKRLKS